MVLLAKCFSQQSNSHQCLLRYRQEGASQWIPVDVDPPSSTKTVIHNLQPGTSYEFQVIGKNVLGDGMFSNIVKERTKGNHRATISLIKRAGCVLGGSSSFSAGHVKYSVRC